MLKWGVGGINVDGCRIGFSSDQDAASANPAGKATGKPLSRLEGIPDARAEFKASGNTLGRWPANICTDGSDSVIAAFPDAPGQQGIMRGTEPSATGDNGIYGHFGRVASAQPRADTGSAARFFFSGKATADDRAASKHPTVKPTALMRWLVTMVTPPGGTVLDPFAGTGSTLLAADQLGFDAIGIEADPTYAEDARRKFVADAGLFADIKP